MRAPVYIRIGKSRIPRAGLGAYAAQALPMNMLLGFYKGRLLTLAQARQSDSDRILRTDTRPAWMSKSTYRLRRGGQVYVDASSGGNWTQLINHAPESRSNVFYAKNTGIYTKRRIEAGEELLVNYGRAAWHIIGRR